MAVANGFSRDLANTNLDINVGGPTVATFDDTSTDLVRPTNGLTVTAGGITITAGGLTVTAGGIYVAAGRITETLTAVDDNSQNMTLAAADVLAGINVHTSATGGGTVTTDTAANLISGIPLSADNQTVVSYYINDGDQTATFAGGTNVTVADTGSTVLTNEAAVLLWRRTSSSAVTLYIMH